MIEATLWVLFLGLAIQNICMAFALDRIENKIDKIGESDES